MYSWCKKIDRSDRGWVEIEEAVGTLGLLDVQAVPQVAHGMCRPCLLLFERDLGAHTQGDD